MAIVFMSLVAAVVLAIFSRKPREGQAERAMPGNAVLGAACFGLLVTMIVLAGPVAQWLGPDSWVAQLDVSLHDRTESLVNTVTTASASANRVALFDQAACAALLAAFAMIQRNRFR